MRFLRTYKNRRTRGRIIIWYHTQLAKTNSDEILISLTAVVFHLLKNKIKNLSCVSVLLVCRQARGTNKQRTAVADFSFCRKSSSDRPSLTCIICRLDRQTRHEKLQKNRLNFAIIENWESIIEDRKTSEDRPKKSRVQKKIEIDFFFLSYLFSNNRSPSAFTDDYSNTAKYK